VDGDLVSFCVAVRETDLCIRAQRVLEREAIDAVTGYRQQLEQYIEHHGAFATALEPVVVEEDAPAIVKEMADAASLAGVGPMAAVAGAIAEAVGRSLMELSPDIVVENGGDIFIASTRKRTVGVYAGDSPFTGKLALRVDPEDTPLGICTSSGTVGHSLSFGSADAAIVVSPSAALADAAATAIGNLVKQDSGIENGIEFAQGISGLKGVVIIKGDQLGAWGDIELVKSGDLCGAR
jgi:ApbE superfamily uncharacterized protein (UPF0280 family)